MLMLMDLVVFVFIVGVDDEDVVIIVIVVVIVVVVVVVVVDDDDDLRRRMQRNENFGSDFIARMHNAPILKNPRLEPSLLTCL
jgi:ABC-type transport system involved in cytochrome bd biosynthesis fused ATPase/permease subunit